MTKLTIQTSQNKQVVDITDQIRQQVHQQDKGICHIFLTHTTAALTTADLDPGTDLDMLDAFEQLIPDLNYRHPHNPGHVKDHILSSLIGTSITIPIEKGRLVLGSWQRVVLIEFNGPRERSVHVSLISEPK